MQFATRLTVDAVFPFRRDASGKVTGLTSAGGGDFEATRLD